MAAYPSKFMSLIKKYTSYCINSSLNHVEESLYLRKLLWKKQGALKELLASVTETFISREHFM